VDVRDKRAIPATEVVEAEAASFAVGDAEQLIETQLL
jgi:hypothetical protein